MRVSDEPNVVEGNTVFRMPVDFEGLSPVLGVRAADVQRPELGHVFDLFDVRDHASVA